MEAGLAVKFIGDMARSVAAKGLGGTAPSSLRTAPSVEDPFVRMIPRRNARGPPLKRRDKAIHPGCTLFFRSGATIGRLRSPLPQQHADPDHSKHEHGARQPVKRHGGFRKTRRRLRRPDCCRSQALQQTAPSHPTGRPGALKERNAEHAPRTAGQETEETRATVFNLTNCVRGLERKCTGATHRDLAPRLRPEARPPRHVREPAIEGGEVGAEPVGDEPPLIAVVHDVVGALLRRKNGRGLSRRSDETGRKNRTRPPGEGGLRVTRAGQDPGGRRSCRWTPRFAAIPPRSDSRRSPSRRPGRRCPRPVR